jgi:hypothetical protein
MPLSPSRVLTTRRYALYFDGIDDYVRTPSRTLYPPLTLDVWIYYMNKPDINLILANSGGGYQTNGFRFFVNLSATTDYTLRIESGNGTSGSNLCVAGVVTPYRFHHAVAIINGANSKLFLNGTTIKSGSLLYFTQTNYVDIGRTTTGGYYFNGMISRVLMYNRPLSDDEVLQNYKKFDDPIRDGLTMWLHAHPDNIKDIDNDGILEWIDLSGNNDHGKIYGATLTKVVKDALAVSSPKRILSVVR